MNVKIGCKKLSEAPGTRQYRAAIPGNFTGIPAGIPAGNRASGKIKIFWKNLKLFNFRAKQSKSLAQIYTC